MFSLYTAVIRIYTFLIFLASFFNEKARLWIFGRQNQLTTINSQLELWKNDRKAWFHAASYGEFEMAKPLISALQKQYPDLKFIVSFYSPSGFENIHFQNPNILKIYLEKDIYKIQKSYIQTIKPDFVVFIKYEFWFNLLRALKDKGIPYYFTSLHMNNDHYLFRPLFRSFLNLLRSSKKIFCHNQTSHKILIDHGFTNTNIIGDTRISQVQLNRNNPKYIRWEKPCLNTIIFGSATIFESEMICRFVNSENDFNIIIAPHDIDKSSIAAYTGKIMKEVSYYSNVDETVHSNVLMIDTLGDLKYLFGNADIAYIGAGFERGPHNVLEPLVFGIPVITGPKIHKFPMARLLKSKALLHIMNNMNELDQLVTGILSQKSAEFSSLCTDFFKENQANFGIFTTEIKQLFGD